jgi:hypothetical protein
MAYSRFDPTATVGPDTRVADGAGEELNRKDRLDVGGPLEVDSASTYDLPVTISFVVVQSDPEDHDPRNARRVRGVTQATVANGRWDASVEFAAGMLGAGEARGIGVAVVEKPDQFAYETLTWCDHIELVTRTASEIGAAVGSAQQD